ncbi:MAG: cell wall hydrolase [Sphingomonadaceae bacterium]|nr:cell wall hydrolase [Sphingomonadaceae bacterium]
MSAADDLDTLVRTVYGEARGEPPEGQQAVASVVLNRSRSSGQPVSSVVTAPGQFEAWDTPSTRNAMVALDPSSAAYQSIRANILPIVTGAAPDPTGGADHFYAPSLQASDGRKKPAWDNGSGQAIGNHLFFRLGDTGVSGDTGLDAAIAARSPHAGGGTVDLDGAFSGSNPDVALDGAIRARSGASAPAVAKPADLDTAFGGGGLVADPSSIQSGFNQIIRAGGTKADVDAFLAKNGIDPTKTTGVQDAINWAKNNKGNIGVYHPGATAPPAGVSPSAPAITPVPLTPSGSIADNLRAGLNQGVEDEGSTLQRFAQWADNKVPLLKDLDQGAASIGIGPGTPQQQLDQYAVDKAVYDRTAGQTMAGKIGRVGGNIIATAPVIAAGGGVLGAGGRLAEIAAPSLAGTTDFLAGAGGPGNLMTRGASLAANGALQGSAAAALTGNSPFAGAVGGAALGPVAGAAGTAANKLLGLARPVTENLAQVTGRISPEEAAAQRVAARIQQDANAGGPTLAQMQAARAGQPDKPLTLMDLGGDNLAGYAGRMARAPGESRAIIGNALNGRDQGAGQRIATDIQSAVSGGGSSYDTAQSLMQARSAAAKPLYDQAYAQPPVSSPKLDAILATPAGRQALTKAATIAANEGRDPRAMGFVLDKDGSVALDPTVTLNDDGSQSVSPLKRPGYSTETLDYVKRGMDDIIEADRDKVTGILHPTPLTSSVQTVKNQLLAEMDATNPAYKAARAAYSGPSTSLDAMNRGRQILNQRPEANRDFIANLSDGDKEFFKQGAADALLEKIARTSAEGDESKRIIGNSYTQQQLRPLFANDTDFNRFMGRIQTEAQMFNTRQAILGGSQTGARVAEDSSPDQQMALSGIGMARSAMAGHAPGIIAHGTNFLQAMADRRSPATNAAVANLLVQGANPGTPAANALQRITAAPASAGPAVPLTRYAQRQAASIVGNKLMAVMNDNSLGTSLLPRAAAADDHKRKNQAR